MHKQCPKCQQWTALTLEEHAKVCVDAHFEQSVARNKDLLERLAREGDS
jgi:hypothetical protein